MQPQVILHSLRYLALAARRRRSPSRSRALSSASSLASPSARRGCRATQRLADVRARLYVSFFRGVPLLVQLLFIYYFLAEFGLDVPAMAPRSAALGFASAAYQAEILRGALNAVPRGQGEAATALGFQRRRHLAAHPAAAGLAHFSVPPLINEFILLLKASSLVSVVGIAELDARQHEHRLARPTGRSRPILAAACSISRSICASRRLARWPSAASRPGRRDEPRRPLALCALAGQRLRRHDSLLGRGRRARPCRRLCHRACSIGCRSRRCAGRCSVYIEIIPRHAVSRAALSALCGRPVDRPAARARRRPAFSGSASIPSAYFAEIFRAGFSRGAAPARSRRRSASA